MFLKKKKQRREKENHPNIVFLFMFFARAIGAYPGVDKLKMFGNVGCIIHNIVKLKYAPPTLARRIIRSIIKNVVILGK